MVFVVLLAVLEAAGMTRLVLDLSVNPTYGLVSVYNFSRSLSGMSDSAERARPGRLIRACDLGTRASLALPRKEGEIRQVTFCPHPTTRLWQNKTYCLTVEGLV